MNETRGIITIMRVVTGQIDAPDVHVMQVDARQSFRKHQETR